VFELSDMRGSARYERVLLESRKLRFIGLFSPIHLGHGLNQIRSAGREEDQKIRARRNAKRSTKRRKTR